MDELSERLRTAVAFISANGWARNAGEIAAKLNVTRSTLSMAINGTRVPSWDLLLAFCDNYPISFEWLRSGTGTMVREERELKLLRKIELLERRIKELEAQKSR